MNSLKAATRPLPADGMPEDASSLRLRALLSRVPALPVATCMSGLEAAMRLLRADCTPYDTSSGSWRDLPSYYLRMREQL